MAVALQIVQFLLYLFSRRGTGELTSLTLKRAEGVTETVRRRDIAQLSGSGLSLMPEGMENTITIEQMADLIAFLLPPP